MRIHLRENEEGEKIEIRCTPRGRTVLANGCGILPISGWVRGGIWQFAGMVNSFAMHNHIHGKMPALRNRFFSEIIVPGNEMQDYLRERVLQRLKNYGIIYLEIKMKKYVNFSIRAGNT